MTHYSGDGRWWWDGHQWQPVPQPPPQPQPPQPVAQYTAPIPSPVAQHTALIPPQAARPGPALWRRRRGLWPVAAVAALALVAVTVLVASGAGRGTRPTTSSRPTALATVAAAAPQQVESTKVATTPAPAFAHFSNGIFEVGRDVQPGTYRMRSGSAGCYFARLKSFGGSTDDILANAAPDGPAVVTILATDRGFQADHCAPWTTDLSPIVRNNSFGPGEYIVGSDLQPGTYRNSGGGQACYFARLRGFTHASSDVIGNNNINGPAIVTVATSDRGFASRGCGTWTKVR